MSIMCQHLKVTVLTG